MPGGVLKELVPFEDQLGSRTFLLSECISDGSHYPSPRSPSGDSSGPEPDAAPTAHGASHTIIAKLLGESESLGFRAGGHFLIKFIHLGCYQCQSISITLVTTYSSYAVTTILSRN